MVNNLNLKVMKIIVMRMMMNKIQFLKTDNLMISSKIKINNNNNKWNFLMKIMKMKKIII